MALGGPMELIAMANRSPVTVAPGPALTISTSDASSVRTRIRSRSPKPNPSLRRRDNHWPRQRHRPPRKAQALRRLQCVSQLPLPYLPLRFGTEIQKPIQEFVL